MRPLLAALIALLAATPAIAAPEEGALVDRCTAETCKARLTAAQLLDEVQKLIGAGRYAEAKPLLAALAAAPATRFETRFLSGYVAEQTGDYHEAEKQFRAMLVDDPTQTRVRLELGRTLLALGRAESADHQFRIAAEAQDLPPEIARTIRNVRNIIRSKRRWSLNLDLGIAPDTNINNATGADTITVLFGTQPIPITLDSAAKARSGVGVTGSFDGGLRLPIAKKLLMLVDFDAFGTKYRDSDYDDISFELAAGPELRISDRVSVRAEAVGAQRDFGARVASRQAGIKGGAEIDVGKAERVGLQLDIRHTDALFDHNYDGWQIGAYATYEHVVARTMIASASAFVRRDWLRAGPYSNTEFGGVVGIGGELPKGFNFGISGGASRALYDDALTFFALEPRTDWRYNARLTVGNRGIRVLGFSPSFMVSYGRGDSSIPFYATERTRFRFALARYF